LPCGIGKELGGAAISRTLVEGTWLKTLRYQCTTHLCQAASGKNSAALSESPKQASEIISRTLPAFLEMLEEAAPACLVLLGAFADAENLPITLAIHPDRHQQRYVANLAGPAALEQMPSR
jgi:hypothetical protein